MSDAETTTHDAEVPSFDSARHFWGRFYDWITKRKSGDPLTEDDLKAGVQFARSSAGGKAKAARGKLAACDLRPWSFAEVDHPGLFVGLFLDPASAAALALDGDNAQPAESLHITLCYRDDLTLDELALARVIARIDDACAWRAPLTGRVAGYGRFLAGADGDADTFYATPDVAGLTDLAMSIKSAILAGSAPWPNAPMAETRDEHEFTPHISLAFLSPGDPNPVETLPDAALRFDAVTVVYDGRSIPIPLRGASEGAYGYTDVVVGGGDRGARLFMEQAFAEPPKRVAILPTPGTYLHGSYGTVDITADRVERFVANHNAKVYGQDLPVQIDGSHDLKLSGAMGWLGSARVEADGSATAEVFWNPRGEQLIREDRVKYLSPEWWDDWTDGATGESYQDVLIGLALTNRPFFKSASLTPLAAEEGAQDQPPASDRQEDHGMPEQAQQTPVPVAMTEEQRKAFREELMAEARKEFADQLAAKDAEAKAFAERVASLEDDKRTKAFADEITGRSDANDTAWAFGGDLRDSYLAVLRALPADVRDEHYVPAMRRLSKSIAAFAEQLGRPSGSDARGDGTGNTWDQIEAEAAKLQASEPDLTREQRIAKVLKTNRELAQKYGEEVRGK